MTWLQRAIDSADESCFRSKHKIESLLADEYFRNGNSQRVKDFLIEAAGHLSEAYACIRAAERVRGGK